MPVRQGDEQTVIPRSPLGDASGFAQLRQTLTDITRELGHRASVTVVPSDDISYDDVVNVLEQVQQIDPRAVALGSRSRVSRN